jgi:hypothetical protein
MRTDPPTPEALQRALPGLPRWKVPEGRHIDWSVIRAELGTDLPSDYRSLAESYPTLLIDDFLAISIPAPGAESDFVAGVRSGVEILRDLWEMDESHGYAPTPSRKGCWSGVPLRPATSSTGGPRGAVRTPGPSW